jgi:hypothetical protein
MNLFKNLRVLALTALFGTALLLSACVVDESGLNPDPTPDPTPVPCTLSVLCRLQNPADTIGLDSAQKVNLVQRINSLDTVVILALATIDIDSLGNDTVRFSLFSDLKVTIDSSFFVVDDVLLPDNLEVLDWRGYVRAPHTGFVDLTFHNAALESGFAHLNGKYLTLYALGGTKALVADDSRILWMGECPGMKSSATTLTCANPLP